MTKISRNWILSGYAGAAMWTINSMRRLIKDKDLHPDIRKQAQRVQDEAFKLKEMLK